MSFVLSAALQLHLVGLVWQCDCLVWETVALLFIGLWCVCLFVLPFVIIGRISSVVETLPLAPSKLKI